MPSAPVFHDTGEQCLFRIICNIWAKPIDDLSEMTIWKMNNLRHHHERFEGLEDFSKQ